MHEPQEELAFARILERLAATRDPATAPCMVEIGSWWAYYSLWFLDRFPQGHTVCLEPDPQFLDVGRMNFKLNERDGTFVHGALGDSPGTPFTITLESNGQTAEVPQYDLPSMMQWVPGGRIDVLLIDAQGAEVPGIARARELFEAGAIRFVVVSTHDQSISGSALTHQRVHDELRAFGGHIVAEHSVSESFSGDGMIVASFDERDRDLTVEVSIARSRDHIYGEVEHRWEACRLEAEAARGEADDLRRQLTTRISMLHRSTSWRVTAPMRRLSELVRR